MIRGRFVFNFLRKLRLFNKFENKLLEFIDQTKNLAVFTFSFRKRLFHFTNMLISGAYSNYFSSVSQFLSSKDKIFTNIYGDEPSNLEFSKKRGDWKNTSSIISKGKDFILNEVKISQIRGRGGAGFSTGTKWGFIPPPSGKPHYLVINADEGEPGTCKDRQILTNEPHKLIEGCLLSSIAINSHKCYIYIRGEFRHETQKVQEAIDEARNAGLIGEKNIFNWPFDIEIHRGAGAYVCGEETALLNSIEGKAGRPRFKPPFPAIKGLFQCPTIVNNVETIASIPEILRRGGKWFSNIGIDGSRGTKIYSISGAVNKPCVVEDALGVSLRDLIDHHAGGVKGGWDNLLCVIPGGLSTQILTKEEADSAVMGYNELSKLGSALGTAAVIVMDKSTNLFEAFSRLSHFYMHESCGQCGPCREGTAIMSEIMEKFSKGIATNKDLECLERTADCTTSCICALAGASSDPIKALLKNFKPEFINKLK